MSKKMNVSISSEEFADLQETLGRLTSVQLLDHEGNFVADLTASLGLVRISKDLPGCEAQPIPAAALSFSYETIELNRPLIDLQPTAKQRDAMRDLGLDLSHWSRASPSNTEYATAVTAPTEAVDIAGVTADDVLAAIEQLRKRPFVMGIWFVDRPADYGRFFYAREVKKNELYEQGITVPHDIPVHNWQSSDMGPDDVVTPLPWDDVEGNLMPENGRVWPWVCGWPGIWLEMSDGQWRLYEAMQ